MTFSPHGSKPQSININCFGKSHIDMKSELMCHGHPKSLKRLLCFQETQSPAVRLRVTWNRSSRMLSCEKHNQNWARLQFQHYYGITQNYAWRTCQIWRLLWKAGRSQIWLAICNLVFEAECICIASSHWAICVHPGSIPKHQVLWRKEIWKRFNSHLEHKNHLGWGEKLCMQEVTFKVAVSEEGITNWYLCRIMHSEQIIGPFCNIKVYI